MQTLALALAWSAMTASTPTRSLLVTEQWPDRVIYQGRTYGMSTFPMEEYFKTYPERRPNSTVTSTGHRRGYKATFIIRKGSLYLDDIAIKVAAPCDTETDFRDVSVRANVVPNSRELKINWYSGIVILPTGRRIDDDPENDFFKYTQYTLLEFANGTITEKRLYTRKQYIAFLRRQMRAFRKSEGYQKLPDWTRDRLNDEHMIEYELVQVATEYTTKFLD
jgi:hypothetical protein